MNHVSCMSFPTGQMPASAHAFLSSLSRLATGRLRLRTPDGGWRHFGGDRSAAAAELHLHDWRACARIVSAGDAGFADAWRAGWVDSPDLSALLRLALRNEGALGRLLQGTRTMQAWLSLRDALRVSRRPTRHDQVDGNFYDLWLDASATYSGAMFEGDFSRSLALAQAAKYRHILDTLGLRAGDRVLELGCGAGGFAIYAAHRGIAVHGVDVSAAQLAVARERAAQHGVCTLLEFSQRPYREVAGEYDAVVSIEMMETLGERAWPQFMRSVRERLRAGGRALVQAITVPDRHFARYRRGTDFIRRAVFPGGMLPSVAAFAAAAARHGMTATAVRRFGPDYAETLRRWRQRFDMQHHALQRQGHDEAFIRCWQFYLCYGEAAFDEGRADVAQILLVREP